MKVAVIGLGFRLGYLGRVFREIDPSFEIVGYVDPAPAGMATLTESGISPGKVYETPEALIAAAGTFTGLGLELGGKDPGYVRADANLDAAVDTLMDGAMFNSGQCCCGIERVYVHESLYDAFVEKAVAWVKALHLGNPFDAASTLGPMANKRSTKAVPMAR